MTIRLYEPHLALPGGFFNFVLNALRSRRGARFCDDPRPLPRMTVPRNHESAWIEIDGKPVFLDMSDHVFLYDLDALRHCAVYFKTNLHRATLRQVLANANAADLESKIRPFFSFAGHLSEYLFPAFLRNLYSRIRGNSEDVCDVVGVYEHLRRDGELSVYDAKGPAITPNRAHYWARVHTLEALSAANLRGTLRLTSRYNKKIEDGELIFPNLSQHAYRRAILRAKLLVINTLPHAILPWKATEALALGRPFVVDIPPLTEFPQPFALREGDHYLSLLPASDFDPTSPGRVLHRYSLADFERGALALAGKLNDPFCLEHLQQEVLRYRKRALNPETVAAYLCDETEAAG
jgi:hypothetical protein